MLTAGNDEEMRKRPVIFAHSIMGNSFLYQALAGCLAGEHVVAIDDPNFRNPDDHFKSLEDMASHYTDLIMQNFEGPYQARPILYQ